MPKKNLLIITTILILIAVVILFMKSQLQKTISQPGPIPLFSPSPKSPSPAAIIPTPSIFISEELKGEKQAQEAYVQIREAFLKEKPWVSKLPLKSGNYFISYDPENDTILATVYYSPSSGEEKEKQIERAKADAISAIKGAGIDETKQPIEFIETALK